MCGGGGLGGILGGSSGQKQTTTTGPWDPLKPYMTGLLNDAQNTFDTGAGKGAQNTGFNWQMDAARGAQQNTGQLLPQYNQMLQGIANGSYLDPATNPNWAPMVGAIQHSVMDPLQRQILPGIDSAAQSQGAYGGSRNGVQTGLATGEATKHIADATSNLAWQNYGAERGLQTQLPQLINAGTGAAMAPGQAMTGVGTQQQSAAWAPIQNFANMLAQFLSAGGTQTSSGSSSPGPLAMFNSLFGQSGAFGSGGGGTSALQGLGSLF